MCFSIDKKVEIIRIIDDSLRVRLLDFLTRHLPTSKEIARPVAVQEDTISITDTIQLMNVS